MDRRNREVCIKMAISISEQYPGKTAGNTTDYPFGEPRNVSAPGDGTGTPWEAAIVKDDQGFKQALLTQAGFTPSGQPDTVDESQYLDAINKIITDAITAAKPKGRTLGMVRFNGATGTIVSTTGGITVARLSTGSYEITMTPAAPNANYLVFLSGSYGFDGASSINLANNFTQTTTKFRIVCHYGGDNTQGMFDPAFVNVEIRSVT